jgi:thioredoxin 1
MAQGSIKRSSEETFEEDIASGVSLVDFYADWCGPCRMLVPVLEKLGRDFAGKMTVIKLDIDEANDVAKKFDISSVPTLILFRDGKEFKRVIGLRDADFLQDFVNSAL